ncbi:MAG: type II secretion system protein GspN, partial [Deltaproteobacteria bacterium]|nr:type II secretion system protein GspN [Deltaproteobacteria bacterium]
MSPRVMRLVKWFGYSSYAIVIFLTMIYLTFPQERVKAVLEAKLSTPEREVRIGGLSVYPLLRLKAEEVRVTLRPPVRRSALRPGALPRKEGEKEAKAKKKVKAKRLVLERVSINVGLLALFRGGVDATFEVKGFGGTLSGRYAMARKGKRIKRWHLEVEAEGISAKEVPQIQTAGPPISGTIS